MTMLVPIIASAFITPGLAATGATAATAGVMAAGGGAVALTGAQVGAAIGATLLGAGAAVGGAIAAHPWATGAAVLGAGNSIAQGNALAGTYAYNAAVMEENAKRAAAESEYNRQQKLRQLRGIMGSQRAAFGSAGIIGGTGSALDIAMDTQSQGELEAAWIDYNGKATANNYLAQANQSRNQASTAKKQGWMNAGLTILGTAATAGIGGGFTSSLGGNNAGNITRMS